MRCRTAGLGEAGETGKTKRGSYVAAGGVGEAGRPEGD